ncbi:MAG: hypothetical protein C0404_01540 [Verrucomicrobia bacterium]|nr:hypothetical protein [Verrucomicrobiota bacterium]
MPEFQKGQRINKYELLEFAGRGAFAEVWKARDTMLNSEVALKFILRLPQTEEAARLVQEEGSKLRNLADSQHPGADNIVYVNSGYAGEGETPPFLDLEWMGGGSLQTRIGKGAQLSQEDVVDIAIQLANALSCAHARSTIHCDIKPGNIMINTERKLYKLSDFGLARKFSELTQSTWGTPAYMSPEQYMKPESVGPKSDIYSLGVVLYQCAEGRLPFEGKNRSEYERKHCQTSAQPIDNPLIAPELKSVIMDCLRKDPEGRPDVGMLIRRVSDIGKGKSGDDLPPPPGHNLEARYAAGFAVPIIVNRETNMEFIPGSKGGHYALSRMITNRDYDRLINEPKFRRWRPRSISFGDHDGGYLQHWDMGKPQETDYDRPLGGIPYEAAYHYAVWLGGTLASADELDAIFHGSDFPEIAGLYRTMLTNGGYGALQFWCRDVVGDGSDMRTMWRLMPQESPLGRQMSLIKRPRYYCFPHYVFLVVLPQQTVRRVIESLQTGTGSGPSSLPSTDPSYVKTQANTTVTW